MSTRPGETPLRSEGPKYVLDATPLIHLAKVGLLEVVLDSFEVYAAESVVAEVTQGEGYPDAKIIQGAVENGLLKVHRPLDGEFVRALLRHSEMHAGEAETLASAVDLGATAVMDDGVARAVARVYGIRTRPGTLYMLFRLVAAGKLDATSAEGKLDEMVKCGLYLDSRTLVAAKEKLRE